MGYIEEYKRWLAAPELTDAEREELRGIADDQKEIESRFYAPLAFGTAGLRGTMKVGLHHMNVYVVRQVTQAMAELAISAGGAERGVAVAHDSRINSRKFAVEAAKVLAANGVKALLFDDLRPTPELSFAIRKYGCIAGINITASHNPREYNGYKAYWEDGAQLPPEHADTVERAVANIDIFTGAKTCDFEEAKAKGLIEMLGAETDDAFLDCALGETIDLGPVKRMGDKLSFVYTPFHGAGYKLVPEVLGRAGFTNVVCVASQMVPDGNFPTVASPNPENPEGFACALETAKEHGVSLIIGTDPDADRVAAMARDKSGEYHVLSGNQTGALLLDYIINARVRTGKMPSAPFAVKSIVSSDMATAICEKNGVKMYETFTGFKFIAERINEREAAGEHCIFSFEESIGYLIGGYCRDKDAVTATLLIAEMAAYYAEKDMTLIDAIAALYEKYGAFCEKTINKVMPGLDGAEKMKRLMADLRAGSRPLPIPTAYITDYQPGERRNADGTVEKVELHDSDVLCYGFEDGSKLLIRPSGTEPKIKFYVLARGEKMADAEALRDTLEAYVDSL